MGVLEIRKDDLHNLRSVIAIQSAKNFIDSFLFFTREEDREV